MPTDTWRAKPIAQDVPYPDPAALKEVLTQLQDLPGLVTPVEIDRLRSQLGRVADGQAFLLQCGDCAELFSYCNPKQIEAKIKLTLLMSLIIIHGARLPVVRVGRIAGQYAKPRSKPTEKVTLANDETKEVLSFRGDNVNGLGVDERTPDPQRLLKAYFHSAATLNHVRGCLSSGMADLHAPHAWSFHHVQNKYLQHEFERIADSITDSLDFMKTVGADPGGTSNVLNTVDYFTSHEGLMLEYEHALTHDDTHQRSYDLSAHTIWLGDRTRQLDGAHVEFVKHIQNPIGIKVGPSMDAQELVDMLDAVNPWLEKGRVTLISRYGASKIHEYLPKHIQAVKNSRHQDHVIWCCDPMHGNTIASTANPSVKTRIFSDVVAELSAAMRLHASMGSRLGGVHLELTGDEGVTECVGGSMELSDDDLMRCYRTHCDPRLNYEQSLDIAFMISQVLRSQRLGLGDEDAMIQALSQSMTDESDAP
ncbi:3-deoxy-7-phosphoheptulonate synthase [Malassezia pachydermatis]|uniref:Phospho-2-dehydro-3-deoxyheptonate aldolase n=1 Tax=Malassezia pachydermatis TaxID=77020 RepID=A0A0M8MXM5_9BASI|nr:phospho-2-dehydro-3-deoxyheptonate aldolase [Malassezia pachydermatis]KOS16394.1 phospho-2-dehydro-3-deoxyheptonate aldolase [Malassezia pachydermatis]